MADSPEVMVKYYEDKEREEQALRSDVELKREGHRKVKELIMAMNGLSEEGFANRFHNDPYFHRGFDVLVEVFMQAKFND